MQYNRVQVILVVTAQVAPEIKLFIEFLFLTWPVIFTTAIVTFILLFIVYW